MKSSPFVLSGYRLHLLSVFRRCGSNVNNARRYSRFAVDKGYIPIAPHLLFPQFLDDDNPEERELGLFFGNALMSKCAEVWVFGSRISSGMEAEIKRAKWKDYRLRYFTEECQEV